MLALFYLGLAIAVGDLLCRRFYRFVSTAHRWAAAILVGIPLSTGFTYLAGLAFAHTAEPLLFANLLFFVLAPATIFRLSRKAPKLSVIAPRTPGLSRWDWTTLEALFAAACVLLIGTLYVNKQGRLHVSGLQANDFDQQLAIAQSIALGHILPIEFPHYGRPRIDDQLLFFFQAGNLEFLGLNLAWSVDVLSVLGFTSMLALVMVLGELLFNSRVVGRLGAALFFFHGSVSHPTNLLPLVEWDRDETWEFWKQISFVNQRPLSFATGIVLLVSIFLVDRYRQRSSAAAINSGAIIALQEPKQYATWNQVKTAFASRFITNARRALTPAKSFVFSGMLLAALPIRNPVLFITLVVVVCCLMVAYTFWWLWRRKGPVMLGRVPSATLTIGILAVGVAGLLGVYSGSCNEVKDEKEPLVKGLVFRNSVIYEFPDTFPRGVKCEGSSKPPVTAFEGGHGKGRGQFDSPRGIATDAAGNILVADTGNGRIEKFLPNGTFLKAIGVKGTGYGQLGEPNGIAIDQVGNIYAADASRHCIEKFAPDGTNIAEWKGPPPGFYGPRRIAIGPDDSIYVVDQGRTRIVKFSPDGQVLASWGSGGSGDGQFNDPTSIAVDSTMNTVFVADPRNRRIQLFDSNGRFLADWLIPEWGRPYGFEDVAIDSQRSRLYASSANMNTILVFDLQGNRLGNLTPSPPDKLEGPSAIAVAEDKLFVVNTDSARISVIPLSTR
jgi:DNA-binding beta-propeller fold protein YncE